jgi:hypothetical protein
MTTRLTRIVLGGAVALLTAGPLVAQEGAAGGDRPAAGSVVAAGVVYALETVTAIVEAIDLDTREIRLRTADGQSVLLVVGAEARNLGQIEAGDTVRAQYQVGLVVGLGPPGVEARLQETEILRTAAGQRPGGVVRSTTAVTATVLAIDMEQRVVRLQGPERTIDLPVAADVDLASVAVGDRVGAVFEESLAIQVEPVATAE